MNRILLSALATILATGVVATAAENPAVPKAKDAALAWLALTDQGSYEASWDAAASIFRASVTKGQWAGIIQAVRSPLGATKSRRVKSATYTQSLPGVPSGDYVVIQFETEFANRPGAIETVTPMLDKDGAWHVSGYFIK
jgi:hypothetical protein